MELDEARKRTETRAEATSISCLSNDNIIDDILLRLPAKSVLRAGAVCKSWRRITTNTRFRAEHARLQPADIVLYTYQFSPRCKDVRRGYFEDELAMDLLPISSPDDVDEAAQRRLIRYPKEITFLLLASCDGVLLFHRYKSRGTPLTFVLCNPTTSHWAELPRLPPLREPANYDYIDEYAFYYHEPSDEYRLLVRCEQRSWFILSTGAAEPREVDLHARLTEMMGITNLLRTTPVALQGRLHWPPRQEAEAPAAAAAGGGGESGTGASTSTTKMVVFDTTSETFHLMAGPPTATADQTKVFEMDGRLVAADFGDEEAEHVDLWFLEDYDAGRWERRHRAPVPWPAGTQMPEERRPKSVAAAGDDREGTVMLGNHLGLLVYSLRTRTVRTVESMAASKKSVVVSRHVFRESLEQHRSFAARSAAELGVTSSGNNLLSLIICHRALGINDDAICLSDDQINVYVSVRNDCSVRFYISIGIW